MFCQQNITAAAENKFRALSSKLRICKQLVKFITSCKNSKVFCDGINSKGVVWLKRNILLDYHLLALFTYQATVYNASTSGMIIIFLKRGTVCSCAHPFKISLLHWAINWVSLGSFISNSIKNILRTLFTTGSAGHTIYFPYGVFSAF